MDGDRGWGLADLRGLDPMDRRVEKETKEKYAQALREQMAMNSELKRRSGDDDGGGSSCSRGPGSGRGSAAGCPLPSLLSPSLAGVRGGNGGGGGGKHTPIVGSSMNQGGGVEGKHTPKIGSSMNGHRTTGEWHSRKEESGGGGGGGGWHTPTCGSSFGGNGATADKVAQVQDMMGQRLRALEEEQQRQWHHIRNAVDNQINASKDAVEKSVHQHFENVVQPILNDLKRAQEECLAQADRARGTNEELGNLTRVVEKLVASQEAQDRLLASHSAEITLLKKGHEDFKRFRAEMERRPATPPPPPHAAPEPVHVPVMPDVSPEAYAVIRNADGQVHELPRLENIIGRAATCTAIISYSQAISNKHVSIDFDADGRASVKDLGSRNGSFLGERRVPEHTGLVIRSGESIQLGVDGPTYTFEFGPAYYARWPTEPIQVGPGERPARRTRS